MKLPCSVPGPVPGALRMSDDETTSGLQSFEASVLRGCGQSGSWTVRVGFLKRKTSQLRSGGAECGGDEFQAAGMVDSKLWRSERIREIPEGSWGMSEETDGKWTRTRLCG